MGIVIEVNRRAVFNLISDKLDMPLSRDILEMSYGQNVPERGAKMGI